MIKDKKNLISVLMSAFNSENYIAEAIQSILTQSYPYFELIISDDGSTDNTKSVIDSFNDIRIKKYHNKSNIGKAKTINKIYKYSTGELITIHDADDISLTKRFEKIIEFFRDYHDFYMCGHKIERISESGKTLGLYREKLKSFEDIKKNMELENTDGDASIFIKREVCEDLGSIFRPYFQNNMDYDLALRIIEKYKSSNIDEVLYYYRNNPRSISKNIPNYKILITQKLTQFFYQERKDKGIDSLEEENWDLIKTKENDFSIPYKNDNTLYLRETAARMMYYQMNKEAVKYSWQAIIKEPFKLINWRTLQYCLRKSIIKI
jgi:glycosyltransferase involved in cell wall biosynthesis